MEFVSAAKAIGANPIRIILAHLLPNTFNIIMVLFILHSGQGDIYPGTLFCNQHDVVFVSIMLLLTGVILFISDRIKSPEGELSYFRSLVIGVAQAIAILPGISRSGATIATAVLLKIDRSKAARFSFLMVLPLIFGAIATEFKDFMELPAAAQQGMQSLMLPTVVGFVAALLSGYWACKWMIAIVKRSQLSYFAYYCWIVGLAGLIFG